MAALLRVGSYGPAEVTDYLDTEFHFHGPVNSNVEAACLDTPWTLSTVAAPLTGLSEVNVACALRPGAARFTCNGGRLGRAPEEQAQLQAQAGPARFVICDNDLSSARVKAQHSAITGPPFFLAAAECKDVASPFRELHCQLPVNGSEAGRLATLDDCILLEPSANNILRKEDMELKGSGPKLDDLTILVELPASPARGVPDGYSKPASARHEAFVPVADAEQPPQQQDISPAPSRQPGYFAGSTLPGAPGCEVPGSSPEAAAAAACGLRHAYPHPAYGTSSTLLPRVPAPTPDKHRPEPCAEALPDGRPTALSPTPSASGTAADSGCDSDVVKRCESRADLEVTSASCADGAATSMRSPGLEAEAGGEDVTQQLAPQGAGVKRRRAAAVAAVRAVRAVKEHDEDEDEDYDEFEGLGAGAGSRAQKRIRKVPGGRGYTGKARSDVTCLNCGATDTPQWRCGPEGPRTLCNACGVRFKKGKPLAYMENKKRLLIA